MPQQLSAQDPLDHAREAERLGVDHLVGDDVRLAAVAAVTTKIGLVVAVDPDTTQPYEVARRVATLHHLSGGRAGWQVGPSEDPLRRREFIEAVRTLWNSWDAEDLPADRDTGTFVRSGAGEFAYEGALLTLSGRFVTPRPPQGHPALIEESA
ncbi:hypothetical protein GCM10022243_53160 [Saccharothrix violaceirubra]|uniref:Alkanesulfonate monooxygenase SsuD/methylene tetrahydromethanopterin reductase-like flavin-dependent oxidoreductase (Luciferase family) n=1 Tax=Saccharothrix violaceirubra TaxID=413306 RepID=A0A7W7WUH1_9PSEU|nr:alkanesulfonate monooxygenase SsuD/methylene tetrahydromethanopterin reductase-like flavin-dependent oxidoreductase (luciferase family) [Saccharothrix violaceirubra]